MTTLSQVAVTHLDEVTLRPLTRVGPDTTMAEVVSLLHESGRGVVLVLDKGKLVGLFTAHDLMARCSRDSSQWRDKPVRELMTPDPITARGNETIATAIDRMVVGNYRHLPILDEAGEAIGVVSIRDLLKHIVSFFPKDFVNLPPDPDHEASEPWGG